MLMMTTFIDKHAAAQIVGRSPWTLKKWRQNGVLKQGIHWVAPTPKSTLYNRDLLIDLVANFNTPEHHEIAIENFLAALPSSQPTVKSTRKIAA
jgi:hypothetical protein